MRLENKVALITGGGSGIGRATASLFSKEGAKVLISDLSEGDAGESARQIKRAGGDTTVVVGDVSVSADAERMVEAAKQAYGKLDVLVNSAGIGGRNALPEAATHEELWDRVMDVNLKGTYLVSWFAVPEMERGGGGSIINLASIMGLIGHPSHMVDDGFNSYGPSKGGVVLMTKHLATDCARKNIRVNCICPGYIATNLTRALQDDPERREQLERRHPMGRFGRPEEIAYAALFLASEESSFVTGAPLIVDGGYTAQ